MKVSRWTIAQWVAAAMVLVVALAAWRLTVAAGRSSARTGHWEAVAGGVQADIAVGHVWLEEYLAGDRTVDVNRDIMANFDTAGGRCRALRDGGTSPDREPVAAVRDDALRADVVALCRRLDGLRALTLQRLLARTVAGTPADQVYDQRFGVALAQAEGLPGRIRAVSGSQEDRLKLIETGAIVLLGATLLLAVAVIRGAQRQLQRLARERETVLELANSALVERGHDFEMLVTAACAVVDTAAQTVTWSLAGHPAPVRLDTGTAVSVKPGLPLGLEAQTGAREAVGPLPPGDGFVLFTDGLYEARGPEDSGSEHFGLGRIGEVVSGLSGAEPSDVVSALRGAAETFTDGTLTDDLCIVAFRAQGSRAPVATRRLPIRGTRVERATGAPGD